MAAGELYNFAQNEMIDFSTLTGCSYNTTQAPTTTEAATTTDTDVATEAATTTDTDVTTEAAATTEQIAQLYPNHYGASNVRTKTENMTNVFSEIEKSLLNETTIMTKDPYNKGAYGRDLEYTLTATMYNATAKNESIISAGAGDTLEISTDYCDGYSFWLRSAGSESNMVSAVLLESDENAGNASESDDEENAGNASEGNDEENAGNASKSSVGETKVTNSLAIRPLCNLNLSKVLFSSVVPVTDKQSDTAEKSEVTCEAINENEDDMILRLDGSLLPEGEAIGIVAYDEEKVVAQNDSADASVIMVIQGRIGNTNWYYRREVSDTVSVSKQDIISDINNKLSEIDDTLEITDLALEDCKVWIERTMSDGMTYANYATKIQIIDSVEVEGIDKAVGGKAFDREAICESEGVAENVIVSYQKDGVAVTDECADWNTTYTVNVALVPKSVMYEFADEVTVTFDDYLMSEGANEGYSIKVSPNADKTLTAGYPITTAKKKITRVTAPIVPEIFDNYYIQDGVSDSSELGQYVTVTFEDDAVEENDSSNGETSEDSN